MPSLETIIAVLATLGVCFGLHSCDIAYLTHKNNTALADQKTELTTQCNTKISLTTGVDHVLQNNLNDINGRLTSDSLPVPACVSVFAGNTTSDNGTSGSRSVGNTGLSAQWLRQKVAAPGSIYRAQLMACQQLLTAERTTQ